MLRFIQNLLPRNINCIYIRQPEPLGLGHAVLCAQPVVGEDRVAVLLADDLIDADPSVIKQMDEVYDHHYCSVISVQQVPKEETSSYGIVESEYLNDSLEWIDRIVEKPKPENAPSTLAVVGRYIFTPRLFHHLSHIGKGGMEKFN